MIVFNEDSCIKCGACEGVCPTSAIEIGDKIVYCDTCAGEPKCAEATANGALQADDIVIDEEGNTQIRLLFNKTKLADEDADNCVAACPSNILKTGDDAMPIKGFCVMCQRCVEICPVDAIGIPGVKEPVERVVEPEGKIYLDGCVGCGVCVDDCPADALTLPAIGEEIIADEDKCISCGVCAQTCPWNAIFIAGDAPPAKRSKEIKEFSLTAEECIGCNSCVDICPGDFITANADLTVSLPEMCPACGLCAEICPVDAIDLEVERGTSKLTATEGIVFDEEKCIYDGACALKCPTEAITCVTARGMKLPSKEKGFEPDSFAMCVRCGACAAACPNDALKLDYIDIEIDGEPVSRDRIIFNSSKCDQCGDCIDVCPYDVLHTTEKPNLPIAGFCTLCGVCVEKCSKDALCYK